MLLNSTVENITPHIAHGLLLANITYNGRRGRLALMEIVEALALSAC